MDLSVVTFLGIGVIGPIFDIYISPELGPYSISIHLFWLLLNREMGLIVHFFDRIYKASSG